VRGDREAQGASRGRWRAWVRVGSTGRGRGPTIAEH
jgi:hypothetical protein